MIDDDETTERRDWEDYEQGIDIGRLLVVSMPHTQVDGIVSSLRPGYYAYGVRAGVNATRRGVEI